MSNTREEVVLINLANSLRKIFAAEKSKRMGYKYNPHKRYDDRKSWIETAKVVQKLNAKPEDYIEAQFRFNKSTVFANTLHGPNAIKNYKRFQSIMGYDENIPSGSSPGQIEVIGKISDLIGSLNYAVESTDIKDPDVKKFLLDPYSDVDPIAAYILFYEDCDIKEHFRDKVEKKLVESPYLCRAIEELGYNISTS